MHVTTDAFPVEKRLAMWREVYGHTVARFEIEPLNDAPFHADVTLRGLPGLGVACGSRSDASYRMTRKTAAGGPDNFLFSIVTGGVGTIAQFGREVTIGAGNAVLVSGTDPSVCTIRNNGRFLTLAVSRERIRPHLADLDAALARPLIEPTDALQLLSGYVAVLQNASTLSTEQLAQSVATHLTDLVIVAAGGTPDAVALAQERGVRAARLHAIKADIARNLVQRDLSAELVAARQGISPRYVRRLLEADGSSFSEFVLAQRLALAYQLLTDRRHFDRAVGEIAFEAGFGDQSYFNRCFRRRYAATPSDVREDAKRRRGE